MPNHPTRFLIDTSVRARLATSPEVVEELKKIAHPARAEVLDVQSRLWNGGLLRAAGAMDTLIAAYALKNNAAVLHYDGDFEHIASVVPSFAHKWILPRGSI